MKNNKISLKDIINQSTSFISGNSKKMFVSSFILYAIFLAVYFITDSTFIAFAVFGIFVPSQIAFLSNMQNATEKIENIFNIKKHFVTYLALALLAVTAYYAGVLMFVVPAILLFVNFALVFDVARDGSSNLLEILSKSQQLAKGHRGIIFALGLVYALILALLIGLGLLVAFLLGLMFPIFHVYMIYLSVYIGLSLFLLFVEPFMIVSFTTLRGKIEQLQTETQNTQNEQNDMKSEQTDVSEQTDEQNTEISEQQDSQVENLQSTEQQNNNDTDDIDLTDYII